MILNRLYELALSAGLLDDPAFELLPVPFVVQLGKHGEYLGITDQRSTVEIPSRKAGAPPKTKVGKGRELPVPRAHGNTANKGFARYFCDTLDRVLPLKDDLKSANSRETFWKQVAEAAEATDDPALRALEAFGCRLHDDKELIDVLRREVEIQRPAAGARCTFAWHPDGGFTLLDREPVKSWYRGHFAAITDKRAADGAQGFCQITGQLAPLAETHATKVAGVPGGIASGVSLASYDKAAFESYGLDRAVNAAIGHRAADGYTRALNALLGNKLPQSPRTCHRLGEAAYLFWTRDSQRTFDPNDLFAPTPEQVEALFESVASGRESQAVRDANDFYCLALSGNSARCIVRGYLELPIGRARANLAQWFRDLSIFDGRDMVNAFPLWQLALATAPDAKQVPPDVVPRLIEAALERHGLPESVLSACLRRLTAEGTQGFRAARLGLLKLILLRKGTPVSEKLDPDERHLAYLCGRLLSVLEQVQYQALGDVNANVVDKFYGAFSTSPSLVFGRLIRNSTFHLRKVKDGNPGAAVALEKRLSEILSMLPATLPAGHFTLGDQARFALGYHHQKSRQFEEIAERMAAKAAAASALSD